MFLNHFHKLAIVDHRCLCQNASGIVIRKVRKVRIEGGTFENAARFIKGKERKRSYRNYQLVVIGI